MTKIRNKAERNRQEKAKREQAREPAGPNKMPRPDVARKDVPRREAKVKTPLAVYIETTGLSVNSFVRASGLNDKTIYDLINGLAVPSLPTAYIIELVTKGVVPMESWLSLPQAKSTLAAVYDKMPAGIELKPIAAGGFAQSMQAEVESDGE